MQASVRLKSKTPVRIPNGLSYALCSNPRANLEVELVLGIEEVGIVAVRQTWRRLVVVASPEVRVTKQ